MKAEMKVSRKVLEAFSDPQLNFIYNRLVDTIEPVIKLNEGTAWIKAKLFLVESHGRTYKLAVIRYNGQLCIWTAEEYEKILADAGVKEWKS